MRLRSGGFTAAPAGSGFTEASTTLSSSDSLTTHALPYPAGRPSITREHVSLMRAVKDCRSITTSPCAFRVGGGGGRSRTPTVGPVTTRHSSRACTLPGSGVAPTVGSMSSMCAATAAARSQTHTHMHTQTHTPIASHGSSKSMMGAGGTVGSGSSSASSAAFSAASSAFRRAVDEPLSPDTHTHTFRHTHTPHSGTCQQPHEGHKGQGGALVAAERTVTS